MMGADRKKESRTRTPPKSADPTSTPTATVSPAVDPAQLISADLTPQSVIRLQRTIGNQGVRQLLAQRRDTLQRMGPQNTTAPTAPETTTPNSDSSTTTDNAQPMLRLGSSGAEVVKLQEKLNNAGANPPLTADGSFGPKTAEAVRTFQSQNGLGADGIVGPATWAKLGGTQGAEMAQGENAAGDGGAGGTDGPSTEGQEVTDEAATEEPTEEAATETAANLEELLQNQVITQSGERFDIVYMPSDVSGPDARPVLGRAIFILKLHLTFLNANDQPVQEPELSAGGADDRDQVWSEEEQDQFRQSMASSIETAWSGKHLLQCLSPGFEALKSGVEIDVQFVNDAASAHNKVTVHKRGTAEDGTPQDRFRSFVQGDRSEFDSRDPTETETFDVNKLNRFTGPFEHGKSEITPEMTAQLDVIANEINALPFPPGQETESPAHQITITGRATSPGTDTFNAGLGQERADKVTEHLVDKLTVAAVVSSNSEGEVGPGDDTRSNEDSKYRRADIFVDPFESEMNTAAHEAGHMFGLGDEYVDMDSGVRRLVGEADSPADPDLLNDEFAEIPAGDTDSIMSSGNVVQNAHYAPFSLKLEKATNLEWTVP